MANTRGKNGTRLCRAFHNVVVEGDCWLRPAEVEPNRLVLVWNLWHSGGYSYTYTCGNRHCINPRHSQRNKRTKYPALPYDHPTVLNRWALLLWFAAGNNDYQHVSLDDALQLLQSEAT